jgi:hypothetical protein
VSNPDDELEDADPPKRTIPGVEVSSAFPSRVKKELNLESSSLMEEREALTFSF